MATSNHYGQSLEVKVENGELIIRLGSHVLAHATSFAEWANPYDEQRQDYIRTFAITDAPLLAKDVAHAMLREREDGSSPLTDFLDKMTEAALDDGSEACVYDQIIENGTTSPLEKSWAAKL